MNVIGNFCSAFGTHLGRCIGSFRIAQNVTPTEYEVKILEWNENHESNINDELLQKFVVYRRSMLIIALIPLSVDFVANVWETIWFFNLDGTFYDASLNWVGQILIYLGLLGQFLLFFGACCALYNWNRLQTSIRIVSCCVAFSFVLPLLPGFFPVEAILDKEYHEQELNDFVEDYYNTTLENIDDEIYKEQEQLYYLDYGASASVIFAVNIFPIIITFPGGAWRGALRVRGLLPHSSLPGWIILLSAPFYSIIVMVALVFLIQTSGNALLVFASALRVLSPWIPVARRHLYVNDLTPEEDIQLDRTQRFIMVNNIVSIILISIWAFLPDGPFFSLAQMLDIPIEDLFISFVQTLTAMLGRVPIMTIVFADRILLMTIADWNISNARTIDQSATFHSLNQALSNNAGKTMEQALEEELPSHIETQADTEASSSPGSVSSNPDSGFFRNPFAQYSSYSP